jgi:hypothetical protein
MLELMLDLAESMRLDLFQQVKDLSKFKKAYYKLKSKETPSISPDQSPSLKKKPTPSVLSSENNLSKFVMQDLETQNAELNMRIAQL